MKKHVLSIFAIASLSIFMFSCKGEKKNETTATEAKTEKVETTTATKYQANTETTVINWKGSKTIGDSHNGTMKISSGSLTAKEGKLESGSFIIDIKSLEVKDIPADDQGNADLKMHLLNADFFDTEKHANAAFSITNVSEKDGKTMVEGNLTLKGVKKNISFPATVAVNGKDITLTSETFTIDRTDFGIIYGSSSIVGLAKDRIISNDIELSVVVNGTAK